MSDNNKDKKVVSPNFLTDKKDKDLLETNGELLYKNVNDSGVSADEMYKDIKVPGEFAGDC